MKDVILQAACGLWCKATTQSAIWKINRSRGLYFCEKGQPAEKTYTRELEHTGMLFHLPNLDVSNTINNWGVCLIFSFQTAVYAKLLNHKFDEWSKQIETGLLLITTGGLRSAPKGKLQCFQEWYTVLHSHGWCIFYVQNQRGFLTFNFKSVYSATGLRADKIS